jgi:hypothetical protein
MALLPQTLNGKITWYESKLPTWEANATGIGSSAPEIAALVTKTEAARAAMVAQEEAQDTAKTKTAALRNAVEAMMTAGADVIAKIRVKASADGEAIYELANIPAPAIPSPTPPPGEPTDFKVKLLNNGAITISWKCANPAGTSGTQYQVWRRVGAAGAFTYLGGTGPKEFTDATIPAGSSQVTYQIQATRSTAIGPWAQFNVNFGVGSAGEMTASVSESPKLAA